MLDQAFRHEVWTRLEPNLRQSPTIDSYLQAAADMTSDVIEVVGSYSFSTSLYGNLITVGTSDRAAWEADQVEFDTEDGPCVEALRTGTVFKAIDLAEDRRWPAWSAVATLLGFSSAAGIPAEVSPGQRIALNLYAPAPRRSTTRHCAERPFSPRRWRAPSRRLYGSSMPTSGHRSWNRPWPVDQPSTRPSACSWPRTSAPETPRSASCAAHLKIGTSSSATSQPRLSSASPAIRRPTRRPSSGLHSGSRRRVAAVATVRSSRIGPLRCEFDSAQHPAAVGLSRVQERPVSSVGL